MGKGSYLGGSTIIGRSGWNSGASIERPTSGSAGNSIRLTKTDRQERREEAKSVRRERAAASAELAEKAAEILRREGIPEKEIRRRLFAGRMAENDLIP